MENNTPELLPCPFCGIKPYVTDLDDPMAYRVRHYPNCFLYEISSGIRFGEQDQWNTRAKDSDKGGNA